MTEEPENFVLACLRRLDAKFDRMAEEMKEMKVRLITIENQNSDLGSSLANLNATVAGNYVGLSSRLDRMESRVERIENRLELTEH
jgi:predicted  nucleic acid-binding Zn-ribbon protein